MRQWGLRIQVKNPGVVAHVYKPRAGDLESWREEHTEAPWIANLPKLTNFEFNK